MKTLWIKKCKDADEKKDVAGMFNRAARLRKLLTSILDDKVVVEDKLGRSKEGYDCPNWAFKQADMQGYKRAMNEIIQLLS